MAASRKPDPSQIRRRYPRAPVRIKAKLTATGKNGPQFEATLATSDISVGGLFFESTFFLKLGQQLDVELTLPKGNRVVRARGKVVRIEQLSESGAKSGFAVRFTEYRDSSDVTLANYFLAPALREFIVDYADRNNIEADEEYVEHVVDVLSAWELKKADVLDPKIWGTIG